MSFRLFCFPPFFLRLYLLLFVFCGGSTAAHALTISGSLLSNTRWTKAQSPIILTGDLTVETGVTLTIDAGVEIRAKNNQDIQSSGLVTSLVELIIRGALVVNGSATEQTSFACETNNTGCWYGIRVLAGATADLSYANIRDARYGMRIEGGTATVSHSRFHRNQEGYSQASGKGTISYSLFYRNTVYGLQLILGQSGDSILLEHLTVALNANYGIYIQRNATVQAILRNSIISHNRTSASYYQIYSVFSNGFSCTNNLIWHTQSTSTLYQQNCTNTEIYNPLFVNESNDNFAIFNRSPARKRGVQGSDMGALAWTSDTTPILHGALVEDLTLPAGTHNLMGDLVVREGVTLTLAAGAQINAAGSADSMVGGVSRTRTELIVYGTLVISGIAANPVVLKGSVASVGSWYGVRLLTGGIANVVYGEFRDAAYGIRNEGGTATVSQSRFHLNQEGYSQESGKANITYSLFYRNTVYGLQLILGQSGDTVLLDHLTVSFNANYGIYIQRNVTVSAILQNSILSQNRTSASYYQIYSVFSNGFTCTNNLIWHPQSTSTLYQQNCANTTASNPLFVDATNNDYNLTSTSPARQKGTDNSDLGALPFTPILAQILISPAQVSLASSATQQFQATAYDSGGAQLNNVTITWQVVAGGGTINASGLFTAGSTAGTFTNTVEASSGNIKGYATVSVTAATIARVEIVPSPHTMAPNAQQLFIASAYDSANVRIAGVSFNWALPNGGGTLSVGGGLRTQATFTAGNNEGVFALNATSVTGGITGTAIITIQRPPTLAKITVSPAQVSLRVGTQQAFTAAGEDSNGQPIALSAITWSATNGSIDQNGLYTAPAAAGNATIRAESGGISGTASVQIVQNAPPSAPSLSSPVDGGQVASLQPTLEVTNGTDPEGAALVYRFEVATDAAFQQVVTRSSAVTEGAAGTTSWVVDLQLTDGTRYYWRAKATDNEGLDSPWMTTASFTVSMANKPPSAPQPRRPRDGDTLTTPSPEFEVINAIDPDNDPVTLHIEIDTVKTFDTPERLSQAGIAQDPVGITTWPISRPLREGANYFWRVRASDGKTTTAWVFGGEFSIQGKPAEEPSQEMASESAQEAVVESTQEAVVESTQEPQSEEGEKTETPEAVVEDGGSEASQGDEAGKETGGQVEGGTDTPPTTGGCGCQGSVSESAPWWFALLLLGWIARRRTLHQ